MVSASSVCCSSYRLTQALLVSPFKRLLLSINEVVKLANLHLIYRVCTTPASRWIQRRRWRYCRLDLRRDSQLWWVLMIRVVWSETGEFQVWPVMITVTKRYLNKPAFITNYYLRSGSPGTYLPSCMKLSCGSDFSLTPTLPVKPTLPVRVTAEGGAGVCGSC